MRLNLQETNSQCDRVRWNEYNRFVVRTLVLIKIIGLKSSLQTDVSIYVIMNQNGGIIMSKERKSNKEVKKPKKQPDGVAKPKNDNKNYGDTDGRK